MDRKRGDSKLFAVVPNEPMEQIIFKVGGKNESESSTSGITICASFYPKSSGIDSLFNDAVKILAAEIMLKPEDILEKVNLSSTEVKEKIRLIVVKNMIAKSITTTTDPYEIVECLTDILPDLKELRESKETYQRIRSIRIEQAEILANAQKYNDAIYIFGHYGSDPDANFKKFLCYLAMGNSTEAHFILESRPRTMETQRMMDAILYCYVNKDITRLSQEIIDITETDLPSSFVITMLLRIKNNITDEIQKPEICHGYMP